jgi:hypothetical protein
MGLGFDDGRYWLEIFFTFLKIGIDIFLTGKHIP